MKYEATIPKFAATRRDAANISSLSGASQVITTVLSKEFTTSLSSRKKGRKKIHMKLHAPAPTYL
jgi:hypothetical protein